MRLLRAFTFVLACILVAHSAPAEACTCVANQLCQEVWEPGAGPPAFFIATVESVENTAAGMKIVRLRHVQSVHGTSSTSIVTSADGDSCGYAFVAGERYFIDATLQADGSLSTTHCSKTTPLAQAQPLIDYLEGLSRPATGGRIFGSAFSDVPVVTMFDDNDRQPVAKLRVTLSGPVTRRAVTRADGSFTFDGLPAGTYRLAFTPPRGMSFAPPTDEAPPAIVLPNARACVEQWIVFERPRR